MHLTLSNDVRVELLPSTHDRVPDKVRICKWVHGQVSNEIILPIEEFEEALSFLGGEMRKLDNARRETEADAIRADSERMEAEFVASEKVRAAEAEALVEAERKAEEAKKVTFSGDTTTAGSGEAVIAATEAVLVPEAPTTEPDPVP